MAFHTDYRPKAFESIYGNANTIESLRTILAKENRPHTYLLTGPTGCGKTTIARIIANELGCAPMDFREINTADNRGIDTVRDIIKQSQYKPMSGDCIVWLIDECHKITNDAQTAMLKILEEPPAHVYFILATTEPEKLISTVKGRCSIFNMDILSEQDMFRLLKKVVKKEGEQLDQEIYDQIILDSLGHPRNALQILEQVLGAEPEMRLAVAKRKAEEYSASIELCRKLMSNASWSQVAEILRGLKGQEPEGIRRAVIGYASAILINGKDNNKAAFILETFFEPLFNQGFAGLVYYCYAVVKG